MKKLTIKIAPKEENICYYPRDFKEVRFLGVQTSSGERYFRVNWATTESDSIFWYPFVGGKNAGVWCTIRQEDKIQRLLKSGCSFFSFDSPRELYVWIGNASLC